MSRLPILCLDFDGVIHSYTSGWQGANCVPDMPVVGAIDFIIAAEKQFELHIFSSRSNQEGGMHAMQEWLINHLINHGLSEDAALKMTYAVIRWPTEKPPALVTIDDRAITFTGEWPNIEVLLNFKPWNMQ